MKIIIAGAYAIGTHLAKLLSRNDQDIVLIDEDEERLNNVNSDYDLMTVHASPSSIKALKDAGTGNADLYIGISGQIQLLVLAAAGKHTAAQYEHGEKRLFQALCRCSPATPPYRPFPGSGWWC